MLVKKEPSQPILIGRISDGRGGGCRNLGVALGSPLFPHYFNTCSGVGKTLSLNARRRYWSGLDVDCVTIAKIKINFIAKQFGICQSILIFFCLFVCFFCTCIGRRGRDRRPSWTPPPARWRTRRSSRLAALSRGEKERESWDEKK